MKESRPIDVLLSAGSQRGVRETYGFSVAVGLWSAAALGYVLIMLVQDQGWLVKLLLLLLWPLLWFLGLVVFGCALLGMAQAIASLLKWSEAQMKQLSSVLILLALSGVAAWLLLDLRIVPSLLSALWFGGLVVMLCRTIFSNRPTPDPPQWSLTSR